MPAKNAMKQYQADGYYHIYNRGVEKRKIFLDEQDYRVFLSYLKEYLSFKDKKALFERLADSNTSYKEKDKLIKQLHLNNFFDKITLLAYCLMPNHFHFLVKQKGANDIDGFMRSLCTRYTMYFNKKYKRVGSLYQGVYKAVIVSTDEQLLHLSRYIHKQALALQGETLRERQPSSYAEYCGRRSTSWIKPDEILSFFSKKQGSSYDSFVKESASAQVLQGLTLEHADV